MYTRLQIQQSLLRVLVMIVLVSGITLMVTACGGGGGGGGTSIAVAPPDPVTSANNGFNIQVRFPSTGFTDAQKALFQVAADRWAQVITQDLPDRTLNVPVGRCFGMFPLTEIVNLPVDDLLIDAIVIPGDGSGNNLARGGICSVRTDSLLPIYGAISFDQADLGRLTESQLISLILHEMAHAMGFGPLWVDKQLVTAANSADPVYAGVQGNTQFRALGGRGNAPIENEGGSGSRDGHWRETIFGNELMTSRFNREFASQPLSVMTIGTMADLGYVVNLEVADPYAIPGVTRTAIENEDEFIGFDELYQGPILVEDEFGKVVHTIMP